MEWICRISLFLLLYAYVLYPLLMRFLARGRSLNYDAYSRTDELPHVYFLVPAHNEEKVIAAKLQSLLSSDYPADRLHILVGLDQCTDSTAELVRQFPEAQVRVFEFAERQGKPGILNALAATVDDPEAILLPTDADILLAPATAFELVRYFRDGRVGLVDARVEVVRSSQPEEKQYLGFETRLKIWESLVFGRIPGPSGGCYALRRKAFRPVPGNLLVDDLYIGIETLLQGWHTLLQPSAVCTEEKNSDWSGEYRRKERIGAGSFQLLWKYKALIWQVFRPSGFIFFSHKVLRWLTPFFLLALYGIGLYQAPFVILIITFFLPFIVFVFGTLGWQFKPLHAVLYFLTMNLALLGGFFQFLKGTTNNVWQPTTR